MIKMEPKTGSLNLDFELSRCHHVMKTPASIQPSHQKSPDDHYFLGIMSIGHKTL